MDFLLSLEKRNYIFKIITAIITVLSVMRILKIDSPLKVGVLIGLLFLFTVNNYCRRNFLKKNRNICFSLSYGLSVLVLGCLNYEILFTGIYIFNIILLIEIIIFNGKLNKRLIVFYFVAYMVSFTALVDFSTLKSAYSDFIEIFLNLFMPCLVLFLFRSVMGEKLKYEKLNEELEEANMTLKTYADKIEELTKAKERNRIAQELHDSMGHSLMALNMSLEYAENVITTKPEKAMEVIHKTRDMTKDCVNDLRRVVSLLKDTTHTEQLRQAINELFHNFKESSSVRFRLNVDDSIEGEPPDIKSCIYKIIREAITNGIKHGRATLFTINILGKADAISLRVENNGAVNENIIKSDGIAGMEERVKLLGGGIQFTSAREGGFAVEAVIPRLEKEGLL
ncbi:sensor histidine kinase [Anaerocolumna xylanovorans]|uniref:histidine kinase n=1 Tax=Anaerocolumna xylanovorans DSM 12503 TaxID=1121345 RepID=A0A1M7Y703_9FIRM|nr:sensor histidine kinase [Anaerocolumna xylanovorans]SHO48423.1 Signal transduction histidine kinase [Anaerocolumna xylanovorans DSM 12503]